MSALLHVHSSREDRGQNDIYDGEWMDKWMFCVAFVLILCPVGFCHFEKNICIPQARMLEIERARLLYVWPESDQLVL